MLTLFIERRLCEGGDAVDGDTVVEDGDGELHAHVSGELGNRKKSLDHKLLKVSTCFLLFMHG